MRLIDADGLVSDVKESHDRLRNIYDGLRFDDEKQICAGQLTTFVECGLRIKEAPTIDPVHAAGGCYCRECKYSYTRMVNGIYGKEPERRCENEDAPWCGNEFATIVEDDDFCSYGRRREEEKNDKQ